MKKIALIAITNFICLGLMTSSAFAAICLGTSGSPCIVQDTENNSPAVKNWRKAQLIKRIYQGDTTGLGNLWMSGSAIPSAQGFATIAEHIKDTTGKKVKKIIVVDLRQESHGYLNNNAITLASQNDWINISKTREQALNAEERWLDKLSAQKNVLNILTPEKFKANNFFQGKTVPVTSIEDEEKVATDVGLEYVRLMVSDHLAPRNKDVDRFVTLINTLPANTWVHIHCRNGEGRTTTFMTMYDMLRNADKVSLENIIKRQASVIPNYNLFDTYAHGRSFAKYHQERREFLARFYKFAQTRLQGYSGSWSEWINMRRSV